MKNNKTKIFVPMDTAAMSMGSNDVAEKIKSIAENQNKNIEIIRNGSWGMSWLEPLIEVCVDDERIAYGPVTVDDVEEIHHDLEEEIMFSGPVFDRARKRKKDLDMGDWK